MNQRNAVVAAIFMFAIVLASVGISAKQSDTWVIYDCNGNALIAYGGAKDQLPAFSVSSSYQLDRTATRAPVGTYLLSAWKSAPFGNDLVTVSFFTDVEYGVEGFFPSRDYRELEGDTHTYWGGTYPQYYSDRIKLSETWRFGGISVLVSFPPGIGASGSGSTIYWSDYITGPYWAMWHHYYGFRAETIWFITYTRQTSTGSHLFGNEWVTVSGTDSGV